MIRNGETVRSTRGKNKYRVIDHIGVGGQADVYKGKDLKTNRTMAIKIFRGASGVDIQRAEYLSRIPFKGNPPIVLPIEMVAAASGEQGYVTEYIDAPTFGAYLDGTVASPGYDSDIKFAAVVTAGLAILHGQNVALGDFRPENIFRLPDDSVLYIDLDNYVAPGMPHGPVMLGDETWFAPEIRKTGDPRYVSAAADVYAMAHLLHILILRQDDASHAKSVDEFKAARAQGRWIVDLYNPQRPEEAASAIYKAEMLDTRLAHLFRHSFSAHPDQRPSASEWAEYFRTLLEEGRVFACPKCSQPVFVDSRKRACPHCHADFGTPALVLPNGNRIPIPSAAGKKIGRSDLLSSKVSGQHIDVQRVGPFLRVTDNNSMNGTWYRDANGSWRPIGKRESVLVAPSKDAVLRVADVELYVISV